MSEANEVDGVVKCQYFGCDKKAEVRIKRANTCVCEEHYLMNVMRFGSTFTTEPVNKKGI